MSKHPIPQALRDQFSAIEDEAARLGSGAQSIFTRMRTSVQAFFMEQPAGLAIPEGWRIERQGNRIVVQHLQSCAGYAAERKGESGIAESVLYLLADTLLAAAPHAVSGEQKAANLRFPTMLRKMWSGGEVQEWIDRQGPLYAYPPVSQDVAGLVEILDSMVCAYRSAIATGYDRITGLGGQCDAVDYMLAAFPDYAKAKAMVAAHRAQQGEQP
ncbi:hypothetical protein SAMN05216588_101256 [Pseudomonas flavescens]|uniref:Uncharacterized protein n=1 Tax=Phytopseudomonas flavescens TaxID=29435 RepID=A0A1G7XSN8_9GAMM|nr:hypothetical protein [Pseudomonas flavescens]SDG87151.1 hypothetical protein SAMN05216588_101256 [Pseudomonas flavescens]